MGHWGYGHQESDSYLDLLGSCFAPIEKIILARRRGRWYNDDLIAASGLLCDILQNKDLYYFSAEDLVNEAVDRLEALCAFPDSFDGFKEHRKRRWAVRCLIRQLNDIIHRGPRSTTLMRIAVKAMRRRGKRLTPKECKRLRDGHLVLKGKK